MLTDFIIVSYLDLDSGKQKGPTKKKKVPDILFRRLEASSLTYPGRPPWGLKYVCMKELCLLQELAEPRLISMPFVTETTRISLIIPVTEPDSKVHPVVRIEIQLGLWIRIQNLDPARKAKITQKNEKKTKKRAP
jgi:hypothetical protein